MRRRTTSTSLSSSNGSLSRDLRERLAVDELHHDVEDAVLLAEIEDVRDVRMLDARRDARLVEEHLLKARVVAELGLDRLDGVELLEVTLAAQPREPHGGHAAGRNGTQKLVSIEPVPSAEDGFAIHRGRSYALPMGM